jgi:WD40 repeat protein
MAFDMEDQGLGLAFDPDGELLAISAMFGGIQYRRVSDWGITGELENAGINIYSLISSPNGKLLASGGRDASIRLWDWNEIK